MEKVYWTGHIVNSDQYQFWCPPSTRHNISFCNLISVELLTYLWCASGWQKNFKALSVTWEEENERGSLLLPIIETNWGMYSLLSCCWWIKDGHYDTLHYSTLSRDERIELIKEHVCFQITATS